MKIMSIGSMLAGGVILLVAIAGIFSGYYESVSKYLPGWYTFIVSLAASLIGIRALFGGKIRMLLLFITFLVCHVIALHWAESHFTLNHLMNIGFVFAVSLLPSAIALILYDLHLEYQAPQNSEMPLNVEGPYCIWISKDSVRSHHES